MRCEAVHDRLADYVDGRCGPITRARIRRHLTGCPDCAEVRTNDEELSVLLETWSDEQPSPSVWLGIREAIDMTPAYVPDTPLVPWWSRAREALVRSVLPYALGAVTTALLVMAGLGQTVREEAPPSPQDIAPVRPGPADVGIAYADGYAPMNHSDGSGVGAERPALRPDEVPLVVENPGEAILIRRNREDLLQLVEELRRRGLKVRPREPSIDAQPAGLKDDTH